MVLEEYALYAPPSYVDVRFELPPNKSKPTEPKCTLDFGDGQGAETFNLTLSHNYTRRIDDTKVYLIRATIFNILGSNVSMGFELSV